MAKVYQHICPGKVFVGKTLLRVLHHGGAHAHVVLGAKQIRQRSVNSPRINASLRLHRFWKRPVFIPYQHIHSCSTSTQRRSWLERTHASINAIPRKPSRKLAQGMLCVR